MLPFSFTLGVTRISIVCNQKTPKIISQDADIENTMSYLSLASMNEV